MRYAIDTKPVMYTDYNGVTYVTDPDYQAHKREQLERQYMDEVR